MTAKREREREGHVHNSGQDPFLAIHGHRFLHHLKFSTPKPLPKRPTYDFKLFKTASQKVRNSSKKNQKIPTFQPFPARWPALQRSPSHSSLEITVRCFVRRLRCSSSRRAKTKLARIRNSSSTTLKEGEPDQNTWMEAKTHGNTMGFVLQDVSW